VIGGADVDALTAHLRANPAHRPAHDRPHHPRLRYAADRPGCQRCAPISPTTRCPHPPAPVAPRRWRPGRASRTRRGYRPGGRVRLRRGDELGEAVGLLPVPALILGVRRRSGVARCSKHWRLMPEWQQVCETLPVTSSVRRSTASRWRTWRSCNESLTRVS
jgi:hypothetical protein